MEPTRHASRAMMSSRRAAHFARLLRDDQFKIAVSVPLVLEYAAVLVRHATELNRSREAAVGVVDLLTVDYLEVRGRRGSRT